MCDTDKCHLHIARLVICFLVILFVLFCLPSYRGSKFYLLVWHCIFSGVADAKSYVIISQLPADVYKKHVDDGNTSHMTGFTFVVISIVHLAGGKIQEGTLLNGHVFGTANKINLS